MFDRGRFAILTAVSDPTTPNVEREILTYERFGSAVRELAIAVHDSGFQPDWIVAVARGGLLIGGALGYALGVKQIASLNIEFYTGVDERLPAPVELPPVLDPLVLATQRVLVADDVVDSGGTLEMVADKLGSVAGELRTCVLYQKPTSTVRCNYVWRTTDRWIAFPWSAEPPVSESRVLDN